jgi:hypothetical protein
MEAGPVNSSSNSDTNTTNIDIEKTASTKTLGISGSRRLLGFLNQTVTQIQAKQALNKPLAPSAEDTGPSDKQSEEHRILNTTICLDEMSQRSLCSVFTASPLLHLPRSNTNMRLATVY